MEYKSFQDIKLSRLGLGNMRLPMNEDGKTINREKAHEIMDFAYNHGVNYFDTAYVYNQGDSEKCVGEWLETKPRDSVYIATKFYIDVNPDYKGVFEEELKRLRTDHIDFYLCHCLLDGNVDKYLTSGCIDYFMELKKQGKIKYLGFSSHAGLEALTKMADHHKWDFAQLQVNYYDWQYSQTKKEYEILKSRGIPVMVMEPVRGGRLASLNEECDAMFKKAEPENSVPSWAFKFVRSLDGVQTILSGMSTLEQVKDNVSTFEKENNLTDEKLQIIQNVCTKFHDYMNVPCTKCRYCCDGCPKKINIPGFIQVYNDYKMQGPWVLQDVTSAESEGKPWECIKCGKCMRHCPQGIKIPEVLEALSNACKEKGIK